MQQAMKAGIIRGAETGIGTESTIGRSALFDYTTEAGRQERLRNLALQQGYLAQTQAPVGGLDPASAIAAEQAARAQNLQAMQQYQQGVFGGAQQYGQSNTDWINQNLGNLANIYGTGRQEQQNYQNMLYQGAAQNAASQNQRTGQLISAGGSAVGALAGAAIII